VRRAIEPLARLLFFGVCFHKLLTAEHWPGLVIGIVGTVFYAFMFVRFIGFDVGQSRGWRHRKVTLDPVPFPIADPDGRGSLAKMLRMMDRELGDPR